MTSAPFALVISLVCAASSLVWIVVLAAAVANRRKSIRLSDLPAVEPESGWPRLAVVIAARDEEAMIARAVRSLLDQDYPDLELIVVDDRSADRTGAILDELAEDEPRLSVVHVDRLPEGWLGKTHAMQRGADETFAPWILFTDGDVVFAPGRCGGRSPTRWRKVRTISSRFPTRSRSTSPSGCSWRCSR